MNATLTLTKLDVLRVLRNGRYLIFAIAMPAALYLIIGKQNTTADGVDFKAYYMLAMATYGAFAGALMNNSIRIATERKSGWTRQLRLTPLPGWGYVFAKVVTSLATTIPSVLVVFGIGAFLNHVEMPAWKWAANAVILWLVSMTFVSLAVAIGYRFDPETAQPAVMLTFFPMAILGGLWFPLGGTLEKIGKWFPTYQAHKLGTDILATGKVSATSIAVVAAWGVLFALLAVVSYRSAMGGWPGRRVPARRPRPAGGPPNRGGIPQGRHDTEVMDVWSKRSAEGPPATAEEGMAGAAEWAGRSVFADLPLQLRHPRVGQPGRYKWLFAAVWLFYLIDPVAKVAGSHHSQGFKLLVYGLVGVFVVAYCGLANAVYPKTGSVGVVNEAPRAVLPILALMAVIALAVSLWIYPGLAGMWVYVGAGAGLGLSIRDGAAFRGVIAVLALMTLCVLVSGELRSFSTWLALSFPIFFAGMSTLGIRQMALLIGELREARTQVARLAANEERLRLARDLHDLSGHSLATITLKAELAQRMLAKARAAAPEGPTPRLDAALKEVEEIEQVSRQTLTDIRQAVSGYRRATLAVEVASAHAALEAAGIRLDASPDVAAATGEFDAQSEAALAWSLREAVTNAIRHSGAARIEVTLTRSGDEMVLTVRNDGRGLAATLGATDDCGGHGLTGLRERLDAVGGRLSVGGNDGDFRLVAAAPVRGIAG